MVVGILQFELLVHGAESLKDKRRVVQSVKDRLHRDHQVSVAEIASQDLLNVAVLGLAAVGSDGKHISQVLDRITAGLRALGDAELGATERRILHGQVSDLPGDAGGDSTGEEAADADLAAEMFARVREENP